jgi:hypothetical protein
MIMKIFPIEIQFEAKLPDTWRYDLRNKAGCVKGTTIDLVLRPHA